MKARESSPPAEVVRIMRIIGGRLRGHRLHSVPGLKLRPTGDRLKESLFNILAPRLPEARFLDLFAGTGAIGLEAWSRGASRVVFVEHHKSALRCLGRNAVACGVREGFSVLGLPVSSALSRISAEGEQFDVVFLDPPYQARLYDQTLELLGSMDVVVRGGWVVAEHSRSLVLGGKYAALCRFRVHRVGDSGLTFFLMGEAGRGLHADKVITESRAV